MTSWIKLVVFQTFVLLETSEIVYFDICFAKTHVTRDFFAHNMLCDEKIVIEIQD